MLFRSVSQSRYHTDDSSYQGNSERFGLASAILLGDLALVWADRLLVESGVTREEFISAQSVFSDMRDELMAGQYLDVLEGALATTSAERSLKVARFKSGKYSIERPLHFGASLAGRSDFYESYSKFGLPLGEAFQLRDDVLGVFGDPKTTGKPAGDANYLGLTLSAFALGLIPVSINLVLLRGLNAFENLKSQVIGNLVMNLISLVLSLVAALYLEPKWVTVGLAAIFTVHYFIGAGISFILIKKHGVQIPVLSLAAFYLKLIFIFVLSIMPIWLARNLDLGGNLIYLLLVLSSSAVIYLVLLKALKISEVTTLIKVIKGRRE